MKRLILFKGGVETLEFFTEQMAAVWEKMGCSVFWYNLILQQQFILLFCLITVAAALSARLIRHYIFMLARRNSILELR